MKTIVKFHQDCEHDIVAWVNYDRGRRQDRKRLLASFLAEIISTLGRTEGSDSSLIEIGARPLLGVSPPTYVWKYSELSVRLVVRIGYQSRWLDRLVPHALKKLFRPSLCRITVMRLLP